MIKHVETVLNVKLTSAVALAMTAMIVKHPSERVQLSQRQRKLALIYVRAVSVQTS